jgi:hypothetical protein
MSAAPIIGGMGFFSFRQTEVAAGWDGRCYSLSRGTPCAGDRPRSTSSGEVACSYPDVVELLTVMALRKTILSFIGLYLDCDVAEAWQSENLLGFCRRRQSY